MNKPTYIPQPDWDRLAEKHRGEDGTLHFDPYNSAVDWAVLVADWAGERAAQSARRDHQHTDLLRFR